MRRFVLVLCIAATPVWLAAQSQAATSQPVPMRYGTPGEMKGLTKVYVFTGPEIDEHNQIVKELKKQLPGLAIVETAEAAELLLVYGSAVGVAGAAPSVNGGMDLEYSRRGKGYVGRRMSDGPPKILMQYEGSGGLFRPTTAFARKFAKAYREANEMR